MVSIVKICEIPVQLGVGIKLFEGNAVDDAPVSPEALLLRWKGACSHLFGVGAKGFFGELCNVSEDACVAEGRTGEAQ